MPSSPWREERGRSRNVAGSAPPSLLGRDDLFTRPVSLQQRDPVKNFCRRFGHQTTIVDRKLYLNGGFVNWNPLVQNPNNATSEQEPRDGNVGCFLPPDGHFLGGSQVLTRDLLNRLVVAIPRS